MGSAAARTVIRWLRWAAVLALVLVALDTYIYIAVGLQWRNLRPIPLAVVCNAVSTLKLSLLWEMAVVVAVATIAPRFRRITALVVAAAYISRSLQNHVPSHLSLADLVLLQGANYSRFGLEALGAVLGMIYIFYTEKERGRRPGVPHMPLSLFRPSTSSAGMKAVLVAGETVIRWLRWVAAMAFIYNALGRPAFSEMSPQSQALQPTHFSVLQDLISMFLFYSLWLMAIVVAGAIIAPRFRCTTAIVLAALYVPISFWGHIFATGGPWWFWTIGYTHVALETFGAVVGVIYICRLEKSRASVASILPDSPSP